MRWLIAALLLFCFLLPADAGSWASFQAANTSGINAWKILQIGGGGFLPNMDIQCDQGIGQCNNSGTTTKVVRTDTNGGYWFNPGMTNCGNTSLTGCWQQIMTTLSMPAGAIDPNGGVENSGNGIYEITIAPSNTSHWYMIYNGVLFTTINKGAAWTTCAGWTPITASANDANRGMGSFIGVSPANESVILVGTPASGVFYSINGCTTMTHLSGVASSTGIGNGYGNALIAFDFSDATGNTAYVTAQNTGIYKITSAITSPSPSELTGTGMPTTFWHLTVDPNGIVYVVDASNGNYGGELHEYTSSTWSQVSSGVIGNDALDVAVDPNNANHVYVMSRENPGELYGAVGGAGGTWFAISDYTAATGRIANDVPWLAWTNESYMTPGRIKFDPAGSNLLDFAEGAGFWQTNPPTSNAFYQWTSRTAAIEELDIDLAYSPPGGNPIIMAQDRPLFAISNPASYPSTVNGCANPQTNSIIYGYSGGYVPSAPSTIVAGCTQPFLPYTDESGISTNGGLTFTKFGALPTGVTSGNWGGCLMASDANHLVWATTGNSGNNVPYYSINGGGAWTQIGDLPSSGWPNAQQTILMCTPDQVTASTMYMYNYDYSSNTDAIYISSNGGSTWTRQCAACDGGSNFSSNSGNLNGFFKVQLQAMPGQAGELLFTPGQNSSVSSHPITQPFYISTNSGVTWSHITNMQDVWAFGFGKAKSGSSYATIYAYGWYSGVPGTWRSTDNGSTWTQIVNDGGYPLGIFAAVGSVSGDNNTYGLVYECFQYGGCVYGQFNYLLSRDLNPANDNNTPAFLNEAA